MRNAAPRPSAGRPARSPARRWPRRWPRWIRSRRSCRDPGWRCSPGTRPPPSSNAVGLDANGNLAPLLSGGETAGGNVRGWLSPGSQYVKAFGTLGADALRDAARQQPAAALFFATDIPAAAEVTQELIRAAGFDPVSIGGSDQVKRIEMGEAGDLHQYGGLQGRVIDGDEARQLV